MLSGQKRGRRQKTGRTQSKTPYPSQKGRTAPSKIAVTGSFCPFGFLFWTSTTTLRGVSTVKCFNIIGKECSMSFCLFRLFNSVSSLITNLAQVCVLFVLFGEKDDKIDKTQLGKANTFLPPIFIHSPIDFQLISPGFAIFLS